MRARKGALCGIKLQLLKEIKSCPRLVAYSFVVVEVPVVNHKDACPLLAVEARDEAEWRDGFAITLKGVELDPKSGCVCVSHNM